MESSIAVFLMRQLACEQLPTSLGAAGAVCGAALMRLSTCRCDLRRRSGVSMLCLEVCCGSFSLGILAEGAIALPVTLSGGVLFAS